MKQPRSNVLCASCKTRESAQWWKAPKGLSSSILCDDCGISWRKYADFTKPAIREDSVPASTKGKAPEKREGTPLNGPNAKRSKVWAKLSPRYTNIPDNWIPQTTKSVTPPASTVPQDKCLACNHYGPLGKIIKCQECGFKTHAGTFGVIAESLDVDNWLCELCQNDKVQEASLDTSCLLCPKVNHDPKDGVYPPADTFLRAQKPTEGQGWVHVLCSVFIPELTFSDTTRLRLVEGISVINPHRWLTVSHDPYSQLGLSSFAERRRPPSPAAYAPKEAAQWSAAVIAPRNSTSLAPGRPVTGSVSKSKQ